MSSVANSKGKDFFYNACGSAINQSIYQSNWRKIKFNWKGDDFFPSGEKEGEQGLIFSPANGEFRLR